MTDHQKMVLDMDKNNFISKIKEILEGIDQCENDNEAGWWETSAGAEFGKDRLNKIILAIKNI